MREQDKKRVYDIYKSVELEVPTSKIEDIVTKSANYVEHVGDEFFHYYKTFCTTEEIKNVIKTLEKVEQPLCTGRPDGDLRPEDVYRASLKNILPMSKTMIHRCYDFANFHKKISYICVSQVKKALSKTTKINPALKSRKINKELNFLNKKVDKEKRDRNRKAEKEALQSKKILEESREAQRQKKKFEYLLSQTELFSEFMLGKKKIESFDQNVEKDEELAALSKKFKEAAIKQKDDNEVEKSAVGEKAASESTTNDFLEQPKMLNCQLKKYQLAGFNWLAKLYDKGINGILADDMGLGKTVQSIALLAHLAETEDNWGPFLIVTPASTLHNWDQELAKFLPQFKVLNYWGNSIARTQARNEFKKVHVILTSYQIAVADFKILRKIKWQYMVLDEAQAIKSATSKRWTTLLGFKTRNRLLLTGTPVQNTMSELWALLHFIMPTLFDSLSEFTEWFSKGIEESAERKKAVDEIQLKKLHAILKPFMLRRLKSDVKTELGLKTELELYCELSPRQKVYYESIVEACRMYEMENIIMQLRKVCNHPDLFEKLETTTKISMFKLEEDGFNVELGRSKISCKLPSLIVDDALETAQKKTQWNRNIRNLLKKKYYDTINSVNNTIDSVRPRFSINESRNNFYIKNSLDYKNSTGFISNFSELKKCVFKKEKDGIFEALQRRLEFKIYETKNIPKYTKPILSSHPYVYSNNQDLEQFPKLSLEDSSLVKLTISDVVNIPPLNTFIIDSGKLSLLDGLLPKLKAEGHRVLLYFQMTKMMDLVEDYLVKKEYSYCRLDGSSKISMRRDTVNDWQTGDKFIFLLSTRAGGLGINLTAADTVIFFDSDWNPTVDQQAMDRAYRIGQTKDVTVYRLITRNTVEEKVIEKATKKGNLQKMIIKGKIFEGYSF
ncbi:Chromatin-remodeling ATPase INO80 [Nosema granulosis]|uniref:Chromatin-remodeling ATPase INO80 n=1 Tax=Nosema granulosis TaxID=83296 RepID=A0A9P6L050_9MICR|nr:Chromatin-remodeling ATPase INO80 [Nosema granulosis]